MNSTLDIPALPANEIGVQGDIHETDEAGAIRSETRLSDLPIPAEPSDGPLIVLSSDTRCSACKMRGSAACQKLRQAGRHA